MQVLRCKECGQELSPWTKPSKGIDFIRRRGIWRTRITWKGKQLLVGYFKTKELAEEAYVQKRLALLDEEYKEQKMESPGSGDKSDAPSLDVRAHQDRPRRETGFDKVEAWRMKQALKRDAALDDYAHQKA